MNIDEIIKSTLTNFADKIRAGDWYGYRERELVSYYCFGHLVKACQNESILYDPAQIGIEIAVPQIANQQKLTGKPGKKKQVCKDIVIWKKPGMTCWVQKKLPENAPLSIIEWKHNAKPENEEAWLQEFVLEHNSCIGYFVETSYKKPENIHLKCSRFTSKGIEQEWILY